MKTKKRFKGIDAASMADVAFLLLIFFMIVTKINQDKGLLMKLPENEEPIKAPIHQRNVLKIYLNDNNELLARNKEIDFKELHEEIYLHVNNYAKDKDKSVHPKKAILVFEQSRGASYESYLKVHDEIKIVYSAIRDKLTLEWTNNQLHYDELVEKAKESAYHDKLKDSIQHEIPVHVQEVLPAIGASKWTQTN